MSTRNFNCPRGTLIACFAIGTCKAIQYYSVPKILDAICKFSCQNSLSPFEIVYIHVYTSKCLHNSSFTYTFACNCKELHGYRIRINFRGLSHANRPLNISTYLQDTSVLFKLHIGIGMRCLNSVVIFSFIILAFVIGYALCYSTLPSTLFKLLSKLSLIFEIKVAVRVNRCSKS